MAAPKSKAIWFINHNCLIWTRTYDGESGELIEHHYQLAVVSYNGGRFLLMIYSWLQYADMSYMSTIILEKCIYFIIIIIILTLTNLWILAYRVENFFSNQIYFLLRSIS